MRKVLAAAMAGTVGLGTAGLGGCGYFPRDPDPIRVVSSPADVSACRRLGSVGIARTDGTAPLDITRYTVAVPGRIAAAAGPLGFIGPGLGFGVPSLTEEPGGPGGTPAGREIVANNLGEKLDVMRDYALAAGATDLLLTRRAYKDWSFVEGFGFRCRH